MIFTDPHLRVFGIDWLEIFANESPSWDYSPDGFRRRGWWVEERGYGTKTMSEMFKLLDLNMHPFVEIRRAPRGLDKPREFSVYKPGDCYIRFDNMYCYDENPVALMLEFLEREHYEFKKIYRIDLYMDISVFDTNDKPRDVMDRIVKHRYSKINQTIRRVSGDDRWDGCEDNWIAWGAPGSMVGTKFYNKTKELKDTKMKKPWIAEQWRKAGYINNVYTLSTAETGQDIWRLEFALKSSSKAWISSSDDEESQGIKYKLPHTLEVYSDPKGVFNAIANLIPFYFRFKIAEDGKTKYECKDKELFRISPSEAELGYRLTSESDTDRVRSVNVDAERTALYYLMKARNKMYGTEFHPKLEAIYDELETELNRKSMRSYSKNTDLEIF